MFKFETIQSLFTKYNALPGIAKTFLSFFVMITAPIAAIAWILYMHDPSKDISEMKTEIIVRMDGMQHQITMQNMSDNKRYIEHSRMLDSIAREQSAQNDAIKNLTIITGVNSNAELLKQVVPYLNRIEDNTWRTILYIQRQEIVNKLDSVKINYRKAKKTSEK